MNAITIITREQASEIIERRTPKGCFLVKEDNVFVAIDNLSSNAWTEEFNDFNEAVEFLGGDIMKITGIEIINNDILDNALTKKNNQLTIDVSIANRENSRLRFELNAQIKRVEYYENLNANLSKRLDAGVF